MVNVYFAFLVFLYFCFAFFLLCRYICERMGKKNIKMLSSHLQPVLKMKVDEFFYIWLSDPSTQSLLKDLDLIKSGQYLDLGKGDTPDKKAFTFNENNNVAFQKNKAEERPCPTGTLSSLSPTSALPSGSSSNTRMTGPNGRVLRKSISTRKVIIHYVAENFYMLFNHFVINYLTSDCYLHQEGCVIASI